MAGQAGPISGHAQILARKPAHDHIHPRQIVRAHLPHILQLARVRPVARQHRARVRINFHLPGRPHAGALHAQIKPAHASEKRSHRDIHQLRHPGAIGTPSAASCASTPSALSRGARIRQAAACASARLAALVT